MFVKYYFNRTIKFTTSETHKISLSILSFSLSVRFPTLYILQDNILAKDVFLGSFSFPVSSTYQLINQLLEKTLIFNTPTFCQNVGVFQYNYVPIFFYN